MLDCTYGCNGILALGNSSSGWPCHGMEHALSAYYDMTHGEGLAIITPSGNDMETAEQGIDALYDFFDSIGIPMQGEAVDEKEFSRMVDEFLEAGFNYFDTAHGYLDGKSELAIKSCLTSRYPRERYILTDKLTGVYFQKAGGVNLPKGISIHFSRCGHRCGDS